MPTYSIQAPNGKTYRIDGPAGASQEQVQQEVMRQFPDAATAAKPAVDPTANLSRAYNNAKAAITRKITDPAQREKALQSFYTDPRIQDARVKLGLPRVLTRKQAVQETARRVIKEQRDAPSIIPQDIRDIGAGALGGANDAFFGLPARAAAAITGTPNDVMQEYANQQGERAPATHILTMLGTGLLSGGTEARILQAGAKGLTKIAPRLGKAAQWATRLDKGKRTQNVIRIAGAGAAAGTAYALGKGEDNIGEHAVTGAVAAPVVAGGIKVAATVGKAVRNILGYEPVSEILVKYVKTPAAEIQRAMEDRAKQGLPSSIYEVLPLGDRQALDDAFAKMPAKARENMYSAVRTRATDMVKETASRVKQIVKPTGSDKIGDQLASDLAASRGAPAPSPEEVALAQRATRSPLDLKAVQKAEANNIMAPHEKTPAYGSVEEMVPQHPETDGKGNIQWIEDNPEIGATIRRAAGVLRIKADGLTFGDVTRIMRHLSKQANRGGIEGDTAAQALNHIGDTLAQDHPKIAPVIEHMRNQWAARARMLSGVTEGSRTRLRENVPVETSDQARTVQNAYDTPEGAAGRNLGQAAQLERDILTSPEQSLRAMNQIANNPTMQRAISENIGNQAGENIAQVAQMQSESARRLSGVNKEVAAESGSDPVHILQNLMMLSPNTLPASKAIALSRLVKGAVRVPQRQAENLVDMLFSTNPTYISKAMKALMQMGTGGKAVLRDIGRDIAIGQTAANTLAPSGDVPQDVGNSDIPPSVEADLSGMDAETPVETAAEPGEEGGESPYATQLQQVYETEDPALLDLIGRVEAQESGGNQSAVSSAGAIGVMQVMPDTAPEAAQLAGLPWDENAYRTDPIYNRLLGIAYLSEMLRKYDGDVEKALAAYNAGPGALDNALATNGENWLVSMPEETQNYVARVA